MDIFKVLLVSVFYMCQHVNSARRNGKFLKAKNYETWNNWISCYDSVQKIGESTVSSIVLTFPAFAPLRLGCGKNVQIF